MSDSNIPPDDAAASNEGEHGPTGDNEFAATVDDAVGEPRPTPTAAGDEDGEAASFDLSGPQDTPPPDTSSSAREKDVPPNGDTDTAATEGIAGEPPPMPASADGRAEDAAGPDEYKHYREFDPFPSILPALLNSADIEDYAKRTRMISPFNRERLKSASYEIGLGNHYMVAPSPGEGNDWVEYEVGMHGQIVLPPNGLIYVALDTKLALPPYIAARFNLKITNVYRGLIAGTGPLVDPGFENDLFIPLHNLSSIEYRFTPGEGLIWMEFTKLSVNKSWSIEDPMIERTGGIVSFPEDKKNRSELRQYLNKASMRPISSSVSQPLDEMKRTVDGLERRLRILQIGGGFAALLGAASLIALVIAGLTFVTELNRDVNESRREQTATTTTATPTTTAPITTTSPTTTAPITTTSPTTTAGTSPP